MQLSKNNQLRISEISNPKLEKYLFGGDERDRTADNLRARQALSQLSYIPGLVISNQLSVINITDY